LKGPIPCLVFEISSAYHAGGLCFKYGL